MRLRRCFLRGTYPIKPRGDHQHDTTIRLGGGDFLARRRFFSENAEDARKRILSLPLQYLRAMDASNHDPVTLQRTDVRFDLHNGKPLFSSSSTSQDPPKIEECIVNSDGSYRIVWNDGLVSDYSMEWVEDQLQTWQGSTTATDRVLWSGLCEEAVRNSTEMAIDFKDAITKEGMNVSLRALYQYGVLLVTNTPIADEGAGVAALASSLGGGSIKNNTSLLHSYAAGNSEIMLPRGTDGPMRTLYGTVWSTTSSGQVEGASVADSAYGQDGLPLHTDMTYYRDPPGLQIFTMVQPAEKGGESIFGDGFAAAERLRESNPEAFDILSKTVRRYRCVDQDTGWHLEASGPVITTTYNGQVVMIRHNDLDRLPDLPPADSSQDNIDAFYKKLKEAHSAWDQILAQDEMRLRMSLQPGDTIVVANQRCFHGRYSFEARQTAPRAVMGCYVSQDELNSRFRLLGYDC